MGKDISDILEKWKKLTHALKRSRAPVKVLSENNRATSILRDMLSQGFDAIYTDDPNAYKDIEEYLNAYQPEYLKGLKMHKGRVSLVPDHGAGKANLKRHLERLFPWPMAVTSS